MTAEASGWKLNTRQIQKGKNGNLWRVKREGFCGLESGGKIEQFVGEEIREELFNRRKKRRRMNEA